MAAVPIPLNRLAANIDFGREGLKDGQGHHASHQLLAPPPERLVQFGGVDAVQPDQLLGHHDGVAVDDLGRGR